MRIEFLTQDDPLYIFPFFDEFLRNYASDFEITRISCSPTMGKRSRLQMLRELTMLYGPAGLGRLLATATKARVLGTISLPREASRFYTLKQICAAYGIPYAQIGNPNAPEFVDSVQRRSPDVLVSVACPYILKSTLLTTPARGCVNIHHAPLPRYKGMMPTFWQMLHGEVRVGVTIHQMAAKVDAGAAFLQDFLDIEKGETLHHLIQRSKRYGAHCMAKVLRQMNTNTHSLKPLNTEESTYFTFPTLAEIREFQNRGFRAI